MLRSHLIHVIALTSIFLGTDLVSGWSSAVADQAVAVTIDDFGYVDTSGEPADQVAIHQKRLLAFMSSLRRDIEADQHFHLVSCKPPCAADDGRPDDRLRAASQADARVLIIGGIHKISTLVQSAKAVAIDVASNHVLYQKLFTFRGDSDQAWERAETFVSEDIRTALAGSPLPQAAATPAPIRLAMFNFELEDTSAGAEAAGQTASDATGLADTTDAVRKLLVQSGRYDLIDVGSASADAAKTHTLRDCGGCDAAIALVLGADQSLVGVVGRVSRTEYTVRFQLREARTGTILASGDSGLRMGANYSWSRGAVHLVRERLLENASPR